MLRKFLYIPLALLAFGLILGGTYAINQGADARDDIRAGLAREQVTIGKDAGDINPAYKKLVGQVVDDAVTAEAQAEIIWSHTMKSTNGKTYATVEKYVAADGKGVTNDAKAAKLDAAGKPVPNPARATAKDGAALRTGLMLAVNSYGNVKGWIMLGWGFVALGLFVLLFAAPVAWYLPRH